MPKKRKKQKEDDPDWTPSSSSKTKIKRKDAGNCIFGNCSNSEENLTKLPSLESWTKLLHAAEIRRHENLLNIAENVKDNEFPDIQYHLQCRKIFTNKSTLEDIVKKREVPIPSF